MGSVVAIALAVALVVILCVTARGRERSRERLRRIEANEKYKDADPQLRDEIIRGVIRVGLSEQQVIDAWGTPMRRTFSQLKTKTKTTLYYPNSQRVYLDNGEVIGWHGPTTTQ